MSRRRKNRQPVQVTLDRLELRHTSGVDEEGGRWLVRGAPVGAVVEAQPGRKGTARRLRLVEPSADGQQPPCEVFGLCGGCQLQEMPLDRQRLEKQVLLERLLDLKCIAMDGATEAYGYRNKIELSYGVRRFLPEDRKDEELEGSWLGFHPPGWFSRIVPVPHCSLATDAMNRVIAAVSQAELGPAWNTRTHEGGWRHLVIRDGAPMGGVVVSLVTTSAVDKDAVDGVAQMLSNIDGVDSILWVVNDGVAEVATGELRAVLHGAPWLIFQLDVSTYGGSGAADAVQLRLPYDAFFQVNTRGAERLLVRIAEALTLDGSGTTGTLLDLYCGSGAIGLALAKGLHPQARGRLIGIELHAEAVRLAQSNAERNGIQGEWHAGKVEEILPTLQLEGPLAVVVDPPRSGLHPKAAQFLASLDADVLVYVACNPSSLVRDRDILEQGGWKLEKFWGVDLFPQTQHIEAIGQFVRNSQPGDV